MQDVTKLIPSSSAWVTAQKKCGSQVYKKYLVTRIWDAQCFFLVLKNETRQKKWIFSLFLQAKIYQCYEGNVSIFSSKGVKMF